MSGQGNKNDPQNLFYQAINEAEQDSQSIQKFLILDLNNFSIYAPITCNIFQLVI